MSRHQGAVASANGANNPFFFVHFLSATLTVVAGLSVLDSCSTTTAAQLTATWTGGGDGSSYSDPNNWDIGQTPINDLVDTFVVVIPGGQNIVFDVVGVGNVVDELTLPGNSSLTMDSPALSLEVVNAASIAGVITADDGSFTASSNFSMFTGPARLFARNGGDIAVAAPSYSSTFSGSQTIMEADGVGSTLDISTLSSLVVNENSSFTDTLTIRAANSGAIDLSGIASASSNDILRFFMESGGSIDLSSLQSTNGTTFDVDIANFALPLLDTVTRTAIDAGAGSTVDLPQLATQDGGSYAIAENATINAGSLVSLRNTSVQIQGSGALNAANLTDFAGSTVTLTANSNFNTGSLGNIDSARFFIGSGLVFDSVTATSYNATFVDSATIMEADGSGSVLDLSSLNTMVVNENSSFDDTLTIHASNSGLVDLSGLTSASSNDNLRFFVESGGDIDLSNLQSTTRVTVDVDIGNYSLPLLDTANLTFFDAAIGSVVSLPALTTHDGGTYTIANNATINAPVLTSLRNTSIVIEQDGALNAANVTDFAGSVVTLNPDFTFNLGALNNIDGARFFVQGGKVFDSVSATTYTGTFISSQTILEADGLGSVLDLSSVSTLIVNENSSFDDVLTVRAANNGTVDFSTLVSASSNDRLRFFVESGGNIDLSMLQTTTRVTFDVDTANFALPELETSFNTVFDAGVNSTIELAKLTAHDGGGFTIGDSGTINAPVMTSLRNASVSIAQNGALNAPAVTDFSGSVVTLTPDFTFNLGSLSSIDGSRFFVQGGKIFDLVSATAYVGTFGGSQTVMDADGVDSLLDLSSLTTMEVNDNTSFDDVLTIRAGNSGTVDLSSLISASSNDRLRFLVESDGNIDLSNLQTSSAVTFDVQVPNYSLPSLNTASQTIFTVGNNNTLNLPQLNSHNGGSYQIATAATINALALISLKNTSVNIDPGGALEAPNVTDFAGSTVTLTPDFDFNLGPLSNIDGARFFVQGGKVFDLVSASSFSGTFSSSQTIMEADGVGSILDLSSLTSLSVSENTSFADTLTIRAANGGRVDLSGIGSSNMSGVENVLRFLSESGGELDLSSLQTAAGNFQFVANSEGTIHVGNLVVANNISLSVTDLNSSIQFNESLAMGSASTVSVTNGGEIHVARNYTFEQTSEGNIDFNSAVLRMDGTGGQQMEVGGENLGVGGATTGNFGFGQLVIGTTTQRTSVDLVDVIDNGNRGGGGESEALYLYGLGGPAGLRILNNSALILNGIDVYAWDQLEGAQVHLNSLFQPGDLRIPFDDGFLQLVPLDFQWANNTGGDFNLGGNWSDGFVPLGSDAAIWNLGSVAGYTVQFGTNVATDSAIIKSDNVVYDLGGFRYSLAALNATTGLVVGQDSIDNGQLTITGGTLASRNARIAATGGSQGRITIQDTGVLEIEEDLLLGTGDATLRIEKGGTADVGGTLIASENGLREGNGTVIGAIRNELGTVSPGTSLGILSVVGEFQQLAGGTLEIELAGTDNSDVDNPQFDQISVDGTAPNGGILEVSFVDAFNPEVGDAFPIITTTGGTPGGFPTIVLPILDAGEVWRFSQEASAFTLLVTADLEGDYNGNGVVDGADYDVWLASLGQTLTAGNGADGDGDGTVGLGDYTVWRMNFGNTAGTGNMNSSAVPEPASFWIMVLLLSSGWSWSRRKKLAVCRRPA